MLNDATYPLGITEAAVRAAVAAGADQAEAYMQYGTVLRFAFQDDHIIHQSNGWQNGLALRIWCQQKVALATTNKFSLSNLHELSAHARQMALAHGIQSVPVFQQTQRGASVFPANLSPVVPTSDKIAAITGFLKTLKNHQLLADALISTCYAESAPWIAFSNTSDFQLAHQVQRSALWLWTESGVGHIRDAVFGQIFTDLDLTALATRLHQQVALLDQPSGKVPDGSCQVLLSPSAAADLALALGNILTGENVIRYLPALLNYMDKKIATSAVTLIDDGTMPAGLHGRVADDEGTRTQKTVIIEKGRLRSLLHSLQTARQLGVPPNGAATRATLWQEPRSTPSNIYLQAGTLSPETLLQQMQRGIAITNVLHPGLIRNETGKFTLIVQGWWVEEGERRYAVSGVQIAINIFELLHKVCCCGNDLTFFYNSSGAGAPSVLLDDVYVSQEGACYA